MEIIECKRNAEECAVENLSKTNKGDEIRPDQQHSMDPFSFVFFFFFFDFISCILS